MAKKKKQLRLLLKLLAKLQSKLAKLQSKLAKLLKKLLLLLLTLLPLLTKLLLPRPLPLALLAKLLALFLLRPSNSGSRNEKPAIWPVFFACILLQRHACYPFRKRSSRAIASTRRGGGCV